MLTSGESKQETHFSVKPITPFKPEPRKKKSKLDYDSYEQFIHCKWLCQDLDVSKIIPSEKPEFDLIDWKEEKEWEDRERTLRNAGEFIKKKGDNFALDAEYERN